MVLKSTCEYGVGKKKIKTQMGQNSLRCIKILSHHHPFLSFLTSFFLPCKVTFMDYYDGI